MIENKFKIDQEVIVVANGRVVKTKVNTIERGGPDKAVPYYFLDGVELPSSDRHAAPKHGFIESDIFLDEAEFRANVTIRQL